MNHHALNSNSLQSTGPRAFQRAGFAGRGEHISAQNAPNIRLMMYILSCITYSKEYTIIPIV